ncbi:MAG: hypothetical protein OER04_05735 [Cyclobacteriaceae bacterium]|nr:hypothetical protein [Cyclobacteriaceae bacterium]
MKKAMMTIALVAFAGLAAWAYAPAKATFSTQDGRLMRVYIDGNLINKYPRQLVRAPRMRPGKHRVVVEVFGRRGRSIKSRKVIVLRPGMETRFNVRTRKRDVALYAVDTRSMRRDRYRHPDRYDYHRPKGHDRNRPVYQDDGYSCRVNPYRY